MNFIFFDIECACVSKNSAKICAFGYCLTDEKFNIIKKEDILINPQGGFRLTDRKGDKGLVLPYDYSGFKSCPTFPQVYPLISRLLTGENVVFGHSVMNDVKYLNLETERFSLPYLDFSFYDTQFIYMNKVSEFERQMGLGGIAEALGVSFTAHKAADDAYATMKIAEAISKSENKDLLSLIKDYKIIPGSTKEGKATDCDSSAREEYIKRAQTEREERQKKRESFCRYVCGRHPKRLSSEFAGSVFSFDKRLEEDSDVSKDYLRLIYESGGDYTFHSDKCKIYVFRDGDRSPKKKLAEQVGATVINEEDFRELFKI